MLKKTAVLTIIFTGLLFLLSGHFAAKSMSPESEPPLPATTTVNPVACAERVERRLLEGTPQETTLYIIRSFREGPTVLVIGGVHGNEPSAYLAADNITGWAVERGTLLVLPRANAPAIAAGARTAPGDADLNRIFPGNSGGTGTGRLAAEIGAIMEEFRPAWVVDLHEALVLEREQPGALGQTIIYPRQSTALDLVEQLLETVNRPRDAVDEQFILRRGAIGGGLIEAAVRLGLDGILVECCHKFPLEDRINHHRQVVCALLDILGMNVY